MRHCCQFKADDIYYLKETNLYVTRKLSIGFCPICQKPVAELVEIRFDGAITRDYKSGLQANELAMKLKDDIIYSMKEYNYRKFKSKPFGWKYGVNKSVNIRGEERVRQYACDFYGNKEIIKTV
ncbi:MAG: hypothetical protein NC408_07830 [Candidatus Gastranaerophilales bacterium]|nr:hypothetical protein [Candidatus Gastranaerophilales bacterium]MCM1072596.1 hypothetical protein [Bacteroides sp.]